MAELLELFEVGEGLDLPEKLSRLRLARELLGDEWVKEKFGKEASQVEAEMREQIAQFKTRLRDLAHRCTCPKEER